MTATGGPRKPEKASWRRNKGRGAEEEKEEEEDGKEEEGKSRQLTSFCMSSA